jgi:hypothetical protein
MLVKSEYAMPSRQDVRRLIRAPGWAMLVDGRIPSSRSRSPGTKCCWSTRAPTGTSHPAGTARIHPCQPRTSPPCTSGRSPRSPKAGRRSRSSKRTVEHVEAAQDDPWELGGDALAYARRIAHETAPFTVRSAAIRAKAKLSQDKPHRIQDRVIAALQAGGPYRNPRLAAELRRVLKRRPVRPLRPRIT